jgi:predicted metal-dependent HD superfamily phosphohydrolase
VSTKKAMIHLRLAWYRLFRQHLPEDVAVLLLAAYKEPHRHYHNQAHINDCVGKLLKFSYLFSRKDEACIAFWFHDVVYVPHRKDNEEQSASLARALMEKHLPFALTDAARDDMVRAIDRVCALIMNTKTHRAETLDAQAFVDIDLSILAAVPSRFARYQQQIRDEYAHVDTETYQKARHKFLLDMSCRSPLFQHVHLRAVWENKAKRNLTTALNVSIA